ncbi:MAG: RNA-binding transcriptional accessory protein [Bacteroidetes bacterium]|nr:RNA-binding transcriptional accessory protein [Bacteroidota bacterium]
MEQSNYAVAIAAEMNLKPDQVQNTLFLLEHGASVPFIARYRKELTGSLDEVAITDIRDRYKQLKDLDARKEVILNSIREQEKLIPELEEQIQQAASMSELEDIYLPYRPKKKTRATVARAKGLEPLAKMIMSQRLTDVETKAAEFINPEMGVNSEAEAIAGACDIIAEWISEDRFCRDRIRRLFHHEGILRSKVSKGKESEAMKYEQYFDWNEPLKRAPSHRILAIFRGESEGFLSVSVQVEGEKALSILADRFIHGANPCALYIQKAIADGYKRLLAPSIETELRNSAREKADKEAIRVFADNLRQLLMAPPLGEKIVLAIDPGFRTGCKVVCLDRSGKLLHNETIYPHPPQSEVREAVNKILNLVSAYQIEAIAIGNGTASRETEMFIRRIPFDRDILAMMVNESGASVYSASPIARQEFPDYDVTVRGAVSIGRRLMDPLAELVKIDPKSIGVGQYQHDVDQGKLKESLDDVVLSCVNAVGVEVNTASQQLLQYVSGIGPVLAKNIISCREKKGSFSSRSELLQVTRFGEKAFEQAAGFIRIRNGINPLDNTAVHPERYDLVNKIASDTGCSVKELIEEPVLLRKINFEKYLSKEVGLPTLHDIMEELSKPGRDPRQQFEVFEFSKDIHGIEDLKPGMILPGIISNITAFGAFVDVGAHQDGLVHISQLSDTYVRDPNTIVKLNQKVMVEVLEVDLRRRRIQLSMKSVKQKR